jgi:PAS domain S-box-containing protein
MANRRILLVDSDAHSALALEQQVAALGCEVVSRFATEREAMESAITSGAQLAFIRLGPGDGSARADGQASWPIPVVYVLSEAEETALGRTSGGRLDVIVLPATNRELRAIIELAMCRGDVVHAVEAAEDRFFASSIDLLCFLGFNGHFNRLNPAWERTLGFTRAELMARPFIEFVHPDDRERTLEQNARVREGGQALAFENRYLCKDGSFRWLHWNATSDPEGQVIYSMARDITAGKLAEEEREQLVRKLQEALTEVRTLRSILPICSYCRKIRDDGDYWHTVEDYISAHTESRFSHSICPTCMATEMESQVQKLEGS